MSGTFDDPILILDDEDMQLVLVSPRRNSESRGGTTVMNRPPALVAILDLLSNQANPVVELQLSVLCTLTIGDVLSAFSLLVLSWLF